MSTTTVKRIRTIGEAGDYTVQHKWKRRPSIKTNLINLNHVYDFCGRSLPLKRMSQGSWWFELRSHLQEEHPEWSTSTVNRVTTVASTVLNFTRECDFHEVKVPEGFKKLKEADSRVLYYTKEQVNKMAFTALDLFDRQDLHDAILVSAYSGVRQSELLKLRAGDIDLNLNVIWVGGRPHLIPKGQECRPVDIHPKIEPILRRLVLDAESDVVKLFGQHFDNGDQMRRVFRKVRNRCGIGDPYGWHTLRASFATWLGEVAHPRQVMAAGGWKDLNVVLRYCHATDTARKAAIHAL